MTKTQQAFAVDAVAAGVSSWRIPMPVALLLAGYLVGVGLLGGMALSAMRFDARARPARADGEGGHAWTVAGHGTASR
jgi:hypothetical protein